MPSSRFRLPCRHPATPHAHCPCHALPPHTRLRPRPQRPFAPHSSSRLPSPQGHHGIATLSRPHAPPFPTHQVQSLHARHPAQGLRQHRRPLRPEAVVGLCEEGGRASGEGVGARGGGAGAGRCGPARLGAHRGEDGRLRGQAAAGWPETPTAAGPSMPRERRRARALAGTGGRAKAGTGAVLRMGAWMGGWVVVRMARRACEQRSE